MAGGQVGGNGSIYWQVKHAPGATKKGGEAGRAQVQNPVLSPPGCIGAHDRNVKVTRINADSVYPNLKKFAKRGHFLVRLRFNGKKNDAIETWMNAAPASLRDQFTTYLSRGIRIVAINVKGIPRKQPAKGKSFSSMPWEIRFD